MKLHLARHIHAALLCPPLLFAGCGTQSDAAPTTNSGSTSTGTSTADATASAGGASTASVSAGSTGTLTSMGDSGTTSAGPTAASSSGGTGTLGAGGTTTSSDDSTSGQGTTGNSSTSTNGSSGGETSTTGTETTGSVGPLTPITVWIAGDSTVANGNTPCPVGWGKVFASHFSDLVTVTNSAVGGRSVRTWLYNVTTEMDPMGECVLQTDGNGQPTLQARWQAMLDGMQTGDFLLIQFGINDGSATCDRHVGLSAFKESYGMMAEAAKSRGAQPVFITPVSSIACNGSTAVGSRGAYVDATFEAGTEYDVPVIDLHQRSVDLYNMLGFCPVPGGDVSASTTGPVGDFFCDDHTHFSDSGAVDIAALVAQGVADQNLALSGYLVD